jgi:S1-C subfamily serine protease
VAAANGLDRATGIAVVEVLEDGPAAGQLRAGSVEDGTLTGGDVIVAIEGTPVRTHEDLSRFLLLHADPGSVVTFTVIRDGTTQSVDVRLGERPPAE